jgi:hypothetical protein
MYAKRCYRTLDKPITVFGLEIEDLCGVVLAAGALLFLTRPILGIGGGLAAWAGLRALKAGKPPGYVFEQAYRAGLLRFVPLPAPRRLLPRAARARWSAVGADATLERRFWGTA